MEKLQFYPLDTKLPPVIQLKLRCKELNLLLSNLQKSLSKKMADTGGMAIKGAWGTGEQGKSGEDWLRKTIEEQGLVRLPDGQIVPKGTMGK